MTTNLGSTGQRLGFPGPNAGLPGLGKEKLLKMLRWMLTARYIDEAELRLQRQQKVFFQISGAGHEAAQAATGLLLHPGIDWFYPYYRDRTLCLALGVTPLEMLLQSMGKKDDPSSGGREMSNHWGNVKLHIVNQSSPTGMQYLQAVGTAEAGRIARLMPPCDDRPVASAYELTYVSGGEGSTSEGEFFEALSTASIRCLPVLFMIEDNKYAISVPVEIQTPGGSISKLLKNYPGIHVAELNGLDPVSSYRVLRRAVKHVRQGRGPALVHAHVIRPFSHSQSDDERTYRPPCEREAEAASDPIRGFETFLVSEGVLSPDELRDLRASALADVADAVRQAETYPAPEPESVVQHLFSAEEVVNVETPSDPLPAPETLPTGRSHDELTLVETINRVLEQEMERDPRIVIFGQDVADCSRSEFLDQVKGKGGVFKVTQGLQRRFGEVRVFNSPLAEANIVGRAIGMAIRGLRPVVEIQFFDYIWSAMMQIRNELGMIRWRSNGNFPAPVVVRVPIGGYVRGGALYHSQSGEAIFCHCPGLRVIFPSNARDACGLLRTAIRSSDPVLFLEHKHLYRQNYNRAPLSRPDHVIPFGKARVARPGRDLTVITYGALVHKSLLAAEDLSREGYDVEVIDLRCLVPWDFEAVRASVVKTSRAVVASEECPSFGVAAEVAARISSELFQNLDSPVMRVGSLEAPVGYSPVLEEATLPQVKGLLETFRKTIEF
jgi:2-oxoisovalerate dehydrogenase E1 component